MRRRQQDGLDEEVVVSARPRVSVWSLGEEEAEFEDEAFPEMFCEAENASLHLS